MAEIYRVELRRDRDGWWVASIPGMAGVHTQGCSIEQAMNRLREALSLWDEDADRAELVPQLHLSATVRAQVRRATAARQHAEQAQRDASAIVRDVVVRLSERDLLSTRDIAALLGLSHQRVHQLLGEADLMESEAMSLAVEAQHETRHRRR